MLYIKSTVNDTIIIAIPSKMVNIFSGKRFMATSGETYKPINITTELGTTEIASYHKNVVESCIEKLFNYIINYDFTNEKDTIIDIREICGCKNIYIHVY